MAAVEEAVVVATEVQADAPAPAEGEEQQQQRTDARGRPFEDLSNEPIDESLLIKVKGKVKRPSKPDDAERNAQVQLLQDEIMKYINRQKQIKEILDNKHSGKGGSPEQQKLREQLQQLRTEWDNVLRGKQRLQAEDGDKKTEREKLLSELRALRDASRGPMNLEALDAKVAELEFKLTHESLSAMEEKRMREQKERMDRTDRPNAVRATALSQRLDAIKAESTELRAQIAEIDKQLNALKAKREGLNQELDALRAKETEARSDVPALIAERKEASEIITALRKKQSEIRDAFNAKWQEFKKQDRAWRVWAAHERVARQQQRKKEYEERQANRKAMEQSHKPNKFVQEVYECEQALAYLKTLAGDKEKAAAAAPKVLDEAPAPGMKLLKKKDEDLDGLFAGGAKKGKGAKKEAARAAGAAAAAADKNKKLTLRMDDLKTFMKLGVKAPTTVADVAAAIDALEAKKKVFEEKRDKAAAAAEEEGEEEAAEEEEAEEEAPKDPVAAAEEDKLADDEDESPAVGVPAVANGGAAKGVWGSRAAAAAAEAAPEAAAPAKEEAAPKEEEAKEEEPAAAAPAAEAAEEEAAAAPEPAKEEAPKEAAAAAAAPAAESAPAAKDGVAVALTVSDEGRVSVALTV